MSNKLEDLEWKIVCHLYNSLFEFCLLNKEYIILNIDFLLQTATVYNRNDESIRLMEYSSGCKTWI